MAVLSFFYIIILMPAGLTLSCSRGLYERKVLSMTKPMREEAITELYNKMVPDIMCIADLGYSSGPNTFFVATEIVKIVNKLCQKLGHQQSPEFQIKLNDLPGNDFNSIFQSLLPKFQAELRHEMGPGFRQCFVSGIPGTFYGRLFTAQSLHFVHSSYSLMWLSKVPEGVEMNKAKICIASTSPPEVVNAYRNQFKSDFSTFLKCRSEEVVAGGKMVLTILGRKSDDPCSKEGCYIWELLGVALQEMVYEGLVEEERLHSFYVPQYTPSPKDVAIQVQEEGSFTINRLEASETTWAACGTGPDENGYSVAKCMRAVAEPLLIRHFGELAMDELFDKYEKILCDRMSKEDNKFVNVTVSMTRQG